MLMNLKNFTIEQNNEILLVTFSNPKSLNALNFSILSELNILIENVENDDTVGAIIFTGEGKAFIAGADILFMENLNANEAKKFGKFGSNIFRKIENSSKIYISAINGFALGGGCEFAMACDLRVASSLAKFGQPEVSLGVTPGFSGTQRLPRIVGISKAKELILTGDIISAEEALRINLINKITTPETLIEESINMATKILKNSRNAVIASKEAINIGMQLDIDSAIDLEANIFGNCFAHDDQKEGMRAFVEKRKAHFKI